MNPIEFISAGAGSGKTHRLTSIMSQSLKDGSARPSGIVAMTFTLKAAAELRQRSRRMLLDDGQLNFSTRVGQARIGTVNAVCSQLLQRYCFEMGLAPEQTVLTEGQSAHLLGRAIDDVLQPEQRAELVYFTRRFDLEPKDWAKPVRLAVDLARSNGIQEEALRAIGPANAREMLAHWPAPQGQGSTLSSTLAEVLNQTCNEAEAFVARVIAAGGKAPSQVALKALQRLRDSRAAFAEGRWTWSQWAALAELDAGAPLRPTVAPLLAAAGVHEQHPEFHSDVTRHLTLVFELASTALEHYRATKRESGALDFVDMEMLFLQALRSSAAVRASLAEELDLVLVDEFQDTSPIQLAVFVELAKLAKRSVWVGDPKQAIYGFRGTDAGLISSVIEAIPGWGGKLGAPLTSSRRSVPSLVGLVNEVFVPAFPKLSREDVQLTPVRQEHPDQVSLIASKLNIRNNDDYFQGLGATISRVLNSGVNVQDSSTGAWRAVQPGDVAVLCQYNAHMPAIAAALHRFHVPCVSARPGLLSTPEASLVVACLRRMHDPLDTSATALIVSLTDSVPASVWLDDRLRYVQSGLNPSRWMLEGPSVHPLLRRLESLKPRMASLTPFEAVCLAKSESGVCRAAAQWSSNPAEVRTRIANVEALVAMAASYEDDCRSSRQPATVAGLLQWLAVQQSDSRDARATAATSAVEVCTHHSAKGLEWPIVVLSGLDRAGRPGVWDVRARTHGAFDAQEPLRGRFIHYWPRPFGERRRPAVLKRAEASPLGVEMDAQAKDERTRLLYVCFTRARDVLVLPSKGSATTWTDEIDASALLFNGVGNVQLPSGGEVRRLQWEYNEKDIAVVPATEPAMQCLWFAPQPIQEHPSLWLRPSSATSGTHSIDLVESVGSRIPLAGAVDMTALGSAVHSAIALHAGRAGQPCSVAELVAILKRWRVDMALDAQALLSQADALLEWLQRRWPDSKVHAEVPVEVRLESGRVVRGQIDLLVDIEEGWVVVDHKADPRTVGRDERLAQAHGPQLELYSQSLLAATGRAVVERWLYLPVAGQAARVSTVR